MINTKWILCSLSCFRQGKQRVAIAKASSNDPEIIFADEPTGNLDLASAVNIMQCFMKINSETAALWTSTAICGGLPFPQAAKGNDLEIHSYCNSSAIKIEPIKNNRKSAEIFQPLCNDFSTINFIFTSNLGLQRGHGILCV